MHRAAHHLADLQSVVSDLGEPHDFVIEETSEPDGTWTYRMFAREPVPEAALILGDLLFNVRSALDHLAVALVATKHRREASFPVRLERPRTDKERASWQMTLDKFPASARALIEQAQPYVREEATAWAAEHHALALLSRLQNADKHRESLAVASGLLVERLEMRRADTGETLDAEVRDEPMRLPPNGVSLGTYPYRIAASAYGSARFMVKDGRRERPLVPSPLRGDDEPEAERAYSVLDAARIIMGYVEDEVLARLEGFVEPGRRADG